VEKIICDEILGHKTANFIQPIEDGSSFIDNHLKIFHSYADFPWTSDYFRGEAESIDHVIAWASPPRSVIGM